MGTDICQYGNHKINFKNRSYREIAFEVNENLNKIQFINEEYIKYLVISSEESILGNRGSLRSYMQERIRDYKEFKKWEWDFKITEEKNYMEIELRGFLDFELVFTHNSIYFKDPPYRYNYWFNCDNVIRDEWRKYMYQIIKLFGGDRVIYLPDQGADHFLDKFNQIPVLTFEEIENEIIKEYGIEDSKLEDFKIIGSPFYYIDNFSNLCMENKLSINEFKEWVKDK